MTRVTICLLCVSALSFWTNENALAEDNISFEVTADFFSKYIWRGQNLVDDWVFQPAVSAGYAGFTASVWGNLDLTSVNDKKGKFTEIDLALDYSGQFPGVETLGYSVGLIYYDFPVTGAADDTLELYWGLGLDVLANPSVTFYQDVDEAEGTYISLGVEHSFDNVAELAADIPVGIDLGASLGWGSSSYNRFYWGLNNSKLNDLLLSASFPVKMAGWTVAPSVSYVTLVSKDIRDTDAYGTDNDFLVAGIGISKRF